MALQAVTGQLYLLDGEVQRDDVAPGLLVQPPATKAARSRSRDSLFVHLSLTGPAAHTIALSQDLLDAISDKFYASDGSVTAALRNAIMEANQQLLRLNLSKTGPPREGALVCAALRGKELFMVQTGEALALIGRNYGVERLPPQPPERVTPLGRTAGLDLRYYHNWLETGDMLLLADPRVAYLTTDVLKPALVDNTVEDSLPELAELLAGDSARLLLVEFTDEVPADLPEFTKTKPSMRVPRPPQPPAREPYRVSQQDSPQRQRRSFTLPDFDLPSVETVEYEARRASSLAARVLARLTGWLAAFLARLRPAAAENGGNRMETFLAPALLAVLIPIVVGAVVTTVFIQRGHVSRMAEIRTEMQQALGMAGAAASDEEARQHFNQALALAAEADELRPGDEEINQLRRRALAELDRIDDITRLTATSLYAYGEETLLAGLALRQGLNGDIYVLDSANNRVLVHDTDESYTELSGGEPEEILFAGQAVGTHVVGTLQDMMWRPPGTQVTNEGLAILDARGALLTFQPNFANVTAAPFGLASDWGQPRAMTQYNERVYVLDTGREQVWRYFPEGDALFMDEGQQSLSLPDLGSATDLAIYAEDGSVVVVYGDGRIRRYIQGSPLWDETSLYASGLESPLVSPNKVKIVGRGLNSSIFVSDPGSGRIIEMSVGGTYLAQYRVSDPETEQELLTSLGDFDVVKAPLRLFVAAGSQLYVATQE